MFRDTDKSPAADAAATIAFNATKKPASLSAQVSHRDPLTGSYTKVSLEQRLNKLLTNNRSQPQQATLAHSQLQNFYKLRSWLGKADTNLLL